MTTTERRKNRSEVPQEAMSLFLEAIAARNSLKALTLANEDGFLVAGAGSGCNLARAAITSLVEDVTGGEDLFASAMTVAGQTLYLTSVGARVPRQKEAAETLQRILTN